MLKIVLLLHHADAAFDSVNYAIKIMAEEWKHLGLIVEIVRGIDRFVPADLVVPHLDLTVTPEEYRAFLAQYPVVVNRNVVDISKSKTSSHLLGPSDSYPGAVVVKSDRNYGGLPERRLCSGSRNHSLSRWASRAMGFGSWRHVEYLKPDSYRVFPSLGDVPNGVFANKNLVVEKFLPEFDGEYYCLRCYYFFGDKEVNTLLKSKEQIVKAANSTQTEVESTPPHLRLLRQRLGFDYGKFDYVLREGEVVLFDLNRTPSIAATSFGNKAARSLAEGIWWNLGPAQASQHR